jgi:hypothetical protein
LPAWWVWNPGQGGGGGGTVHTDGVTIQGDGSVASPVALLDAMTDGSTLLGAGIAANKLAIIPSIYLSAMSGSNFTGFTENFVAVCGFTVPTPLTFSNLVINIANADDAPVLNDFGIYDFAGNLIANTGPFSFPVATQPVFPMQQGEQTIPQGLYLFAATSDGDGLAIYGDTNSFSWFETTAYTGFPTGGSLPSTIPPPGIVPNLQTFCVALF